MKKVLEKLLVGVFAAAVFASPTPQLTLADIEPQKSSKPYYCQVTESKQEVKYELTKEKMEFLVGTGLDSKLIKERKKFIEYADRIRNGELTGTPLGDSRSFIFNEGIVHMDDIRKVADKYDKPMDGLYDLLAAYGLSLIDGMPTDPLTDEHLNRLTTTGLMMRINKDWEKFVKKHGDELDEKRLSDNYVEFQGVYIDTFIGKLGKAVVQDLVDPWELGDYSIKMQVDNGHAENRYDILMGTLVHYVDWKLFEEMPKDKKLVNYQIYMKLDNQKSSN